MADEMDNLFTALKIFKSGINEFQFNQSVSTANDDAAKIRASADDEFQKRRKLQSIADSLAAQASLAEKPATTIEALTKAVGPEQIKTGDQAILAGELQGKPELTAAGVAANKASKSDEMMMKKEAEEFQLKRDKAQADLQRELAGIKAGKSRTLDPKTIKELADQDSSIEEWGSIINKLDEHPDYSSVAYRGLTGAIAAKVRSATDPDFGVWKNQVMNKYLKAKVKATGASGAEKELAEIRENQPNFNDSKEVTKLKMQKVQAAEQSIRDKQITGFARNKYDVSAYTTQATPASEPSAPKSAATTAPSSPQSKQSAIAAELGPGAKYLGRKLIKGVLKEIYQTGDGRKVAR